MQSYRTYGYQIHPKMQIYKVKGELERYERARELDTCESIKYSVYKLHFI